MKSLFGVLYTCKTSYENKELRTYMYIHVHGVWNIEKEMYPKVYYA